jgi:hypothetical protein
LKISFIRIFDSVNDVLECDDAVIELVEAYPCKKGDIRMDHCQPAFQTFDGLPLGCLLFMK